MGRTEHLQRLAFGRSAFQDLRESDQSRIGQDASQNQASSSGSASIQVYDSKGRPRNRRTEDLNARLRHAQNEALAMVGIVERKESADADAELEATLARGVRDHLLAHENAHGEELNSLAEVSSFFIFWWPQTLLKRVELGLYTPDLSFAGILALRRNEIRGSGLQGIFRGLYPGYVLSLMHNLLYQCVGAGIEEAVSSLQQHLIQSGYSNRKATRLHTGLKVLCEVLLLILDVALAPLDMYASALQLGLAPLDTPWRMTCTTLIPAYFRYTYATIFASPIAFLTSPAALLIAFNFLIRDDASAEYETPYFTSLTSYRLPDPVLSANARQGIPPFRRDPFGATLGAVYNIRTSILQWFGWDALTSSPSNSRILDGWATDRQVVHDEDGPRAHIDATGAVRPGSRLTQHRSTSLARLPAFWLGKTIDTFLCRVLVLPLETLVMKSIASFYLASPMSVTPAGAALGLRPAAPGLLSLLLRPSSSSGGWSAFGKHMSHLGLGLAVWLAFEAVSFGAVYQTVKKEGVRYFQWGQKEIQADREIENEK